MIFVSLASGSSGNCTFIGTDTAKILIDCGISAKRIDESLRALGFCAEELNAIFLTHEHTDHIKGLKRLMSAYQVPVYGSAGTLSSLARALRDEYFNFAGQALMHEVRADETLVINGLRVMPFQISHDAAQPFAYRMEAAEALSLFADGGAGEEGSAGRTSQTAEEIETAQGFRTVAAAVATDMGYFNDEICSHLMNLDVLLLEANHDRGMLANGPYPMSLKRRIMSREGHLSNNSCGQLLAEIINPRLSHVFLGHLSKENNTPHAALETVEEELLRCLGPRARGMNMPKISVAPHDGMSEVVRI